MNVPSREMRRPGSQDTWMSPAYAIAATLIIKIRKIPCALFIFPPTGPESATVYIGLAPVRTLMPRQRTNLEGRFTSGRLEQLIEPTMPWFEPPSFKGIYPGMRYPPSVSGTAKQLRRTDVSYNC